MLYRTINIITILLILIVAANAAEIDSIEPEDKDLVIQTEAVREVAQERTADQIINEQPKDYKPLAVLSMILVGVIGFGGITLSYLYRKGYI